MKLINATYYNTKDLKLLFKEIYRRIEDSASSGVAVRPRRSKVGWETEAAAQTWQDTTPKVIALSYKAGSNLRPPPHSEYNGWASCRWNWFNGKSSSLEIQIIRKKHLPSRGALFDLAAAASEEEEPVLTGEALVGLAQTLLRPYCFSIRFVWDWSWAGDWKIRIGKVEPGAKREFSLFVAKRELTVALIHAENLEENVGYHAENLAYAKETYKAAKAMLEKQRQKVAALG